jgi:2-keto-4-pentenoate hydratase/2-oxohepta-3-ene-1,7-dioic acid hydratase in catechol pathway
MRYITFEYHGQRKLGVREGSNIRLLGDERLEDLLANGVDLAKYGAAHKSTTLLDEAEVLFLPPLMRPPKILCVGLNYSAHVDESPFKQLTTPTIFFRTHTTLVGHGRSMIRPLSSDSLDYEGELAVVLSKGGRHIKPEEALDHVAGYSLFNEGTVREYQYQTTQWTMGKNFDFTGAFGPELVTADELPLGAKGLQLETRLNGAVVQSANTDSMIFNVATLISFISQAMTLEPGDVLVTGTPAGIGWERKPRLLLKEGDVCEVSATGLGTLRNSIADEASTL